MNIFRDVREFHREMKILAGAPPLAPLAGEVPFALLYAGILRSWRAEMLRTGGSVAASRFAWLFEELAEALEAHVAGDLVEQVDARIDLMYFLAGDLDFMGVRPSTAQEVWCEVHAANMRKLPQQLGAARDAKIIKPEDWTPPDVAGILSAQEGKR